MTGKPGDVLQQAKLHALVNTCRKEFESDLTLHRSAKTLSQWFCVVRREKYERDHADSRLKTAFADPSDNPAAWCSASRNPLNSALSISLSQVTTDSAQIEYLSASVRYLLGRAAMQSMIRMPAGSLGLALTYGLLWPVNHDGIAAFGADDELKQRLAGSPDALVEVENEARSLSATAIARAYKFDRERVASQIRRAAKPASLEACGHWRVSQLPIDLDFGRVVQVIGSDHALMAARLLDLVNNPALVATILAHFGDQPVTRLSDLLPQFELVFGADGQWTGASAAWMVLLVFETTVLARLGQQSGSIRLGGERPVSLEAVIQDDLDLVMRKLLYRHDGERLALEWLAHLMSPLILERRQFSPPDNFQALNPQRILTAAVSARLAKEAWARPVRVWGIFGGAPLVKDLTKVREKELVPPAWMDWLGQPNRLVPVAVAVQISDRSYSTPDWLIPWVRSVCRELEAGADARQLADAGSTFAADYLAWPLARSGQSGERFNELWADASWRLTRARFSRLDEAADRVRPCVAILRVGIRMLGLVGAVKPIQSVQELASSLADAVDQVRYTLPEMGVGDWAALSGSLTAALAVNGLLEREGCARLLSRYHGDDACLAAAAVNAVANGVPKGDVHRALAELGEDAAELATRWARWNSRFAKDQAGGPSEFLSRLQTISGSTPEA